MFEIMAHPEPGSDVWDGYVRSHPDASSYHLWGWREALGTGLGHTPHYLSAWRDGRVCGVLPLIQMNRPLLGRILVSLPFVNYGGILADDEEVARAMQREAVSLAQRLGAKGLELRHRRQEIAEMPAKTHRVSMVLPLPDSVDALWKGLGSKLRSQIRKADKSGLLVRRGGLEELPAFYDVFAHNMRDLGSPVWPKRFFQRILTLFPERARLYRVDLDGRPLAVGFIFRFQQTVEIPWASSLREFNPLCANVRLYWEILADATREGYSRFDFGRSDPDGGTFRFKQQWGAQPQPLYWHVWPGTMQRKNGLEGQRERIEAAWSRLPVWTTRLMGPSIRRWLPQ